MDPTAPPTESVAARLKAATELLEKVAGDRALLAQLTLEERTRLLTAAGDIYCPDLKERRRLVKARVKQRKAEKLERDQSKLNETGIR
ncbi:MAG: oxidoreductase, partial [Verrucomicrobia bacterium]|nr:oxidoreductase [Verrucomicrobiota bacterium]NDD39551.1 oxidoreductase [Verrucomicrobiota bacterium]NDE99541.1 oxidoreductase [Verrucomicrobiota bacterium]